MNKPVKLSSLDVVEGLDAAMFCRSLRQPGSKVQRVDLLVLISEWPMPVGGRKVSQRITV